MDGSAASGATIPGVEGYPDEVCVSEVLVLEEAETSVVGASVADVVAALDPVIEGSSSPVERWEEVPPQYSLEDKSKDSACPVARSVSAPAPVSLWSIMDIKSLSTCRCLGLFPTSGSFYIAHVCSLLTFLKPGVTPSLNQFFRIDHVLNCRVDLIVMSVTFVHLVVASGGRNWSYIRPRRVCYLLGQDQTGRDQSDQRM